MRKGQSKTKSVRPFSRTNAGTPAGSLAPDSLISDLPLTGTPINWEASANSPVSTQLESVRRSKSGQRKPGSPTKHRPRPQSNRPKTSVPRGDISPEKVGWLEAALAVHAATDSEAVKADADKWIRLVRDYIEDQGRHQPWIYGVSVLSQPQMVVRGLGWYARFFPDFWHWYAAHTEFACELIAAIIRWESCRGDSSEERIKKFLINRPGITVGGQTFIFHSGFSSGEEPLPPTATDPQICQAFKEFTKQAVDPKLVSNARQRWFGKDQKYKGDLSRRIDCCLSRHPIPQIPPSLGGIADLETRQCGDCAEHYDSPDALQDTAKRNTATARAEALLKDQIGLMPVWIRAPKSGGETYTGLTRSFLYQLAANGP